jgi:hypothetical protein
MINCLMNVQVPVDSELLDLNNIVWRAFQIKHASVVDEIVLIHKQMCKMKSKIAEKSEGS